MASTTIRGLLRSNQRSAWPIFRPTLVRTSLVGPSLTWLGVILEKQARPGPAF